MKKYKVIVYDCCGEFDWEEFNTFIVVPATVAAFRSMYPDKIVRAFNNDRADYDFDGLTDEERDAIDAAA